MPSEAMPQTAKGVLAAVASNVLFAMLFLYSSWMKPMNGTDVFAWRMVGMLFALFALASLTHSWQGALNFASGIGKDWKRWLLVILPTPILASQLWLFVWSPVNGEGINVAMGYFLFPLAMMLVGRIWFKERLGGPQRLAVTLACAGVACQLWCNGAFSWATVWVFGTYPLYYLLRRKLGVPSLIGLLIDLIIITPCMLVYIVFFSDSPGMIAAQPSLIAFIILIGINSALAMYLNLQANNMLPMAVFGMLSYLEPILLFVIAVLWLDEPLENSALAGYGLIWLGLSVMIVNSLIRMKKK